VGPEGKKGSKKEECRVLLEFHMVRCGACQHSLKKGRPTASGERSSKYGKTYLSFPGPEWVLGKDDGKKSHGRFCEFNAEEITQRGKTKKTGKDQISLKKQIKILASLAGKEHGIVKGAGVIPTAKDVAMGNDSVSIGAKRKRAL